jgi:two-component system, response regulator PdtaR
LITPAPKILMVEDEALLLLCVADELRDAGYEVIEATNADQAIKFLEKHSDIQVLFTDVDMPGSMDGLKLSALVANRWPPIKIIVTSGKQIPKTGLLPANARFFPKPYEVTSLQVSLGQLTGHAP